MTDGVDYSYSRPSPAGLVAAGKKFVVRYGAAGNSGKWLTAAEVTALKAAGLDIVANVEETAKAFQGTAAGVRHATAGDAFFRNLGMPVGRPIYFSVDWDAGTADWPTIDAALRGAASVIGAARVGVYGGYDTIAHCSSAGTARWFWQTYAWSGGKWHPACHLQQYQNSVALAGGTVDLDRSMIADFGQWGAAAMPMNPRTHPRGARPDFTLPKPNPSSRTTDALWWLVCMRLALEPLSENGGTYANKPQYHNAGENLPDYGLGDSRTDPSIRRAPDREGPWWQKYCSAHDWTFDRAHTGNYTEINLYMGRLVRAMKDPNDLRPDNVYAYTIGQLDGDPVVEGYSEYTDAGVSGDSTHLWHRHDSFRRNIVGDYWAMWKALTIDMGWTYAEWRQSLEEDIVTPEDFTKIRNIVAEFFTLGKQADGTPTSPVGQAVLSQGIPNPIAGGRRTPAYTTLADIATSLTAAGRKIDVNAGTLATANQKIDDVATALTQFGTSGVNEQALAEAIVNALPEGAADRVVDAIVARIRRGTDVPGSP